MDSEKSRRIWELDFLRGFSILLMVFDHLMYDLKSIPYWFSANYATVGNAFLEGLVGFAQNYWTSALRNGGHYVFVAFFLLVSGICFTFSRSNLKRGLKFFLFACLISVITFLGEKFLGLRIGVFFGIIHMFSVAILLTWLLRKIWNNDLFILAIGLGIIIYGMTFDWMHLAFVNHLDVQNVFLIILGQKGFGADSFGLVPYAGVLMVGTVIGNVFYKNRVSLLPHLDGKWNAPIVFAGKHSFAIFLFHQLVIFGLVVLLAMGLGYRF
jgi:uncharacterized membrane protein